MAAADTKRVLVVANRTAATTRLLEEVQRRAAAGPCEFTLLIPDATDPFEAEWTLDTAVPLLARAAGAPIESRVGGPDPYEAVRDALADGDFDEVIVSTLPRPRSTWLGRELPRRVAELGVPVTPVVSTGRFTPFDLAPATPPVSSRGGRRPSGSGG